MMLRGGSSLRSESDNESGIEDDPELAKIGEMYAELKKKLKEKKEKMSKTVPPTQIDFGAVAEENQGGGCVKNKGGGRPVKIAKNEAGKQNATPVMTIRSTPDTPGSRRFSKRLNAQRTNGSADSIEGGGVFCTCRAKTGSVVVKCGFQVH